MFRVSGRTKQIENSISGVGGGGSGSGGGGGVGWGGN